MSKLKKTKRGYVLSLDEKIDGEAFFEARKKVLKVFEAENPRLVLDLEKLESLTAWAVFLLAGANKTASSRGGKLFLRNPSGPVSEALSAARLEVPLEGGEG